MTSGKTAVALRVLTAYNLRQHPYAGDVLLLRSYCPEHADLAPDEMACIVIQEMNEEQRQKRMAKVNGQDQADTGL